MEDGDDGESGGNEAIREETVNVFFRKVPIGVPEIVQVSGSNVNPTGREGRTKQLENPDMMGAIGSMG